MCVRFFCSIFIVLSFIQLSYAQNAGCRDLKANNYQAQAVLNDGSCSYSIVNIVPDKLFQLPKSIRETSGLVFYDGYLWTHNDSGGESALYAIDTSTGQIIRKVIVQNARNIDWEDIAIDEKYFYIADIGNNNGNRKDLKIYSFPLDDLSFDTVQAISIGIFYPDQVDFSSQPNKNNYDAEALVCIGENLYVFSKNWSDARSRIYSFNKKDTNSDLRLLHEWNSNGMITGADFNPNDSVLIMCGYHLTLQPFIWLFWDFHENDIWTGNKRRINLNLPFHQIEGVTYKGNGEYYLSNEEFNTLINVQSAVFTIDTRPWIDSTNNLLKNWDSIPQNENKGTGFKLYPNPAKDILNINWSELLDVKTIEIFSANGKNSEMWWAEPNTLQHRINISQYESGAYIMVLSGSNGKYYNRFVVQK